MGNFYVSTTNGNDSTGTGTVTQPWATIMKAINDANAVGEGLRADDTLWIAPGMYHEAVVMDTSAGTPPSAGHEVKVRGDPDLTQAWNDESPGQIIITAARKTSVTAGEAYTLQAQNAVTFNSKANVWFYDIQAQGGSGVLSTNSVAFFGASASANQKCVRCIGIGIYSAFSFLLCEDCVGISSQMPFTTCRAASNGSCKRCVAIGGYYGFVYCDGDNCLSLGSYRGNDSGTMRNSTFVSNYYAGYSALDGSDNNLMITPYYATNTVNCDRNVVVAAYIDTNADRDLSDNRQIWCRTQTAVGANQMAAAHILEFPPAMQIIRGLSKALKPETYREYDMANGSGATAELTDIEGRSRSCYNGIKTCGPWAIASKSMVQHATYGTTIKITRDGEEVFYLPVEANRPVTVTVSTICTHPGTAATWPSVTLTGDGLTADTDTAADVTDVLVVSATPTRNEVAKVVLKANDVADGHYTQFHSLRVS